MAKLMVICFDGLNRKAVEKYNLQNIKQKEYGDVRTFTVFSGSLWSSLVTGVDQERHKITSWKPTENGSLTFFRDKCKLECVVDYAKKPLVMYYPYLDKRWRIFLGLEHKSKGEIVEKNRRVYLETLSALDTVEWDLCLVCFMIIDNLGHRGELDREDYVLIDGWCKNLIEKGKPDIAFVMGDKDPDHRPPAYYSCSRVLNLRNPKWTDFYGIFKRWLTC